MECEDALVSDKLCECGLELGFAWLLELFSKFQAIIALAAISGIIIYRLSVLLARHLYGSDPIIYKSLVLLPITAAILNLIIVSFLNNFYDFLAKYLTDLEYRRTQTDYDESLSFKVYLFQFINYYSAIIYLAFLKGKLFGSTTLFGLQQEECLPGGCLLEIFIQLSITMIGKQAITVLLEISVPFLDKIYKILMTNVGLQQKPQECVDEEDAIVVCNQWTEDYKLYTWSTTALYPEYLEMGESIYLY